MGGSLSVGALAIASADANAVGAVRLTLLPRRLEVELLAASSYKPTFVPGPLTELARFSVPYTAVRGFVRREEGLVLSLDPLVAAPHSRFHLVHFTDLPLEALASAHKRRAWLATFAWLTPIPLALAVAAFTPEAWAAGVLGRGALLVATAVLCGFLLRAITRAATFGGPGSARLLHIFERRLAERVGLRPALTHETDPFEVPEPEPVHTIALPRVPVRHLVLGFATVAVLSTALAAFRFVQSLPAAPPPPEPTSADAAPTGPALDATEAGAAADPAPAPRAFEACTCARTDSPLWRGGLPVLSVIPIAKHPKPGAPLGVVAPEPDRKGVPRYEFDVAVVNNASVPVEDVKLVLTFARRNEKGDRVGVTDRGLFFEGELAPARSVKWSVKAPGTEMKIDVSDARLLGDAVPAAAADRYRKLLSASKPAVRLHAAMMLAWLGDPGAADAARALGELGEAEEAVRQRILRAASALRVCDVKVDERGGLAACAFNAGAAPVAALRLSEVTPDGAGRSARVDGPVPAGAGARFVVGGFVGGAEELTLEPAKD